MNKDCINCASAKLGRLFCQGYSQTVHFYCHIIYAQACKFKRNTSKMAAFITPDRLTSLLPHVLSSRSVVWALRFEVVVQL